MDPGSRREDNGFRVWERGQWIQGVGERTMIQGVEERTMNPGCRREDNGSRVWERGQWIQGVGGMTRTQSGEKFVSSGLGLRGGLLLDGAD